MKGKDHCDNNLLELVHLDLCGPMVVHSIGGAKYVLTSINALSRRAWVYFFKHKSKY